MGRELGARVQGVSHLALNSSDMARTVAFYEKLGIPLVKTMDIPEAGFQHFFFDVGNGDCLAYFWFNDAAGVPAQVGQENFDGAMNHVAFKISPDDVEAWWDHLTEQGIPFGFVAHGVEHDDNVLNDLSGITEKTFAASFYLNDPDGAQIEFCAWYPAWDNFKVDHPAKSTESAARRMERVPSMVAATLQKESV